MYFIIIFILLIVTVHHNIPEAVENKCTAAQVLLDLSRAFDVIDYKAFQRRLEYWFGVTGIS